MHPPLRLLPLDHPDRLAALRRTGLLDSAPDEAFDRLARLAARLVGAQVSLVSLVDAGRQFFKAAPGLAEPWATARQTPLSHSLCRHVVSSGAPLVIEDAASHPLTAGSPAVTELGVGAYAGFPLVDSGGVVLGAFCAIGPAPRPWSPGDLATLGDLAAAVATEIELRAGLAERERAAAELRAREAAYEALAENSPDAVIRVDRQLRHLFVNRAVARASGIPAAEFSGRTVEEMGRGSPASERWSELARRVIETGTDEEMEFGYDTPGGRRWYQARIVAERAAGGEVESVLTVTRDITGLREAQEALLASEERFRALIEHSADVMDIVSADGKVLYLSPSVEAVLGYRPEEIVGRSSFDLLHPDDLAPVAARLREDSARPGTAPPIEFRLRHADGSWRLIEAQATNLLDNPAVGGIVVNARDVTARRQAEAALRDSEALLRSTLDALSAHIVILDADGRIVARNLAWTRFGAEGGVSAAHGGESGDYLAVCDRAARQGDLDAAAVAAGIRAVLGGETALFEHEYPCHDPGGEERWFVVRVTGFLRAGGTHVVVAHEDVTARHAAEAALRESEARFRNVAESLGEGLLLTDPGDTVLYANRAMEEVTGYAPGELVGRVAFEVLGDGGEVPMLQRIASRLRGVSERYRMPITRKGGRRAWVEVVGTPLRNAAGEVVGTLGALTDVTERRRAEGLLEGQTRVLERIALGAPLPEVLSAVALLVEEHTEGAGSSVMLLDEGGTLRVGAAPSLPSPYVAAVYEMGVVPGPFSGSCGTAAWRGERVVVTDIAADPLWAEFRHLPLAHGLRACWSEPVRDADGSVLGTFATYYREPRGPTPSEVEVISLAAHLVRVAVQHARAGEALRRSEQLFRSLIENAHDVTAVLEDGGRIRFASPSAARLLDVVPGELAGRDVAQLVHPDDVDAVRAALGEAVAHPGEPRFVQARLRARDGSYRTVEAVGTSLLDDPHVRGVVVNARDVTERLLAQEALRGSEERFRLLVDTVRDYAILMLDADGYVTSWNAGAEQLFGWRSEEVLGRHAAILSPPDEGARVAPRLADAAAEGRGGEEGWRQRADGTRFWADTLLTALRDEGGRLLGFAEVVRDLSERREAEEALRRSEARLWGIVSSAMDAIISVDAEQRIVVFNAAAERMFGCPAGQALGEPIDRFIPARFREGHARGMMRFGETGVTSRTMNSPGTLMAQRADGSEFPIEATISQVEAAGRRLFTVIVRDVTDRLEAEEALRRSEEQLRLAQRMEAVGRLAGGIAHDFNNILMAVGGHVQLLLRRTPQGEAGRWNLEEIKKGADRAASLTRQLLAFSRRQVLQPRVLDLNAVVRGTTGMLERLIGEDVELVADLDESIAPVRADATQLEQVLMNLVVNSRDAMPDGGVVVIQTGEAELDEEDVRQYPYVRPGRFVRLSVTDTGHGMDEATQRQMFEPFFTTKEPGKGTGLGLSTVYGIVKQSGGYIWAESTPGAATTFRILLPRAAAEEAAAEEGAAPALPSPATPGGSETVLLAEDEEGVRTLVRTVLREHGYRVLEAEDGEEAIAVARRDGGEIDLLLTDMVMPGMGGRELAARLALRRPRMRVLYISGYDDAFASEGTGDPDAPFLQKPISPDELARRVREVLDGAPRRAP